MSVPELTFDLTQTSPRLSGSLPRPQAPGPEGEAATSSSALGTKDQVLPEQMGNVRVPELSHRQHG